jgi:hypothetical protein
MNLEVSFYFRELKDGSIECTSVLNSDIRGIGINKYEAEKDYFKKFNKYSDEMIAEVKPILDSKNIKYETKKYIFIRQ